MEEIKISVIVAVYGVEKYIGRCVSSLFGQTMTDGVEFIFVNDCTKDRSIELLTEILGDYPHLASRVKIINHLRNRGLAAARQTGLEAARGDYILHLDSDDYFETDMLEVMYDAAIAHDSDVVMSDFFMSYKNREVYSACPLPDGRERMLKSMIAPWSHGSSFTCLWNKLTKRRIYIDNNIRFIEGINYGEDLTVAIKILYHAAAITKVDRALIHYNQENPCSYTRDRSASNIRQLLKATDVVSDFLSGYTTAYDDVLDERRFLMILLAITHSGIKEQREFLQLYPWLDYDKHKHILPFHWRFPYKMALRGHFRFFCCMRGGIRAAGRIYKKMRAML